MGRTFTKSPLERVLDAARKLQHKPQLIGDFFEITTGSIIELHSGRPRARLTIDKEAGEEMIDALRLIILRRLRAEKAKAKEQESGNVGQRD